MGVRESRNPRALPSGHLEQGDSPGMERQLLQRHWRTLAHWKPASWHLPLAVFLAGELLGACLRRAPATAVTPTVHTR
jgi:hypothetical protein